MNLWIGIKQKLYEMNGNKSMNQTGIQAENIIRIQKKIWKKLEMDWEWTYERNWEWNKIELWERNGQGKTEEGIYGKQWRGIFERNWIGIGQHLWRNLVESVKEFMEETGIRIRKKLEDVWKIKFFSWLDNVIRWLC